MRYFPAPLDRDGAAALVARCAAHDGEDGFAWWIVDAPERPCAGFVLLLRVGFSAPFAPAVEIGWRFAAHAWGRGWATEAAAAVLDHAFTTLGLPDVVAFTVPANERSRALMERLGMRRDPADDFEHPRLPAGHPLRPDVLYRLRSDGHRPGPAEVARSRRSAIPENTSA
jgi:RimJ/RimL family protein N-acetyltransferase